MCLTQEDYWWCTISDPNGESKCVSKLRGCILIMTSSHRSKQVRSFFHTVDRMLAAINLDSLALRWIHSLTSTNVLSHSNIDNPKYMLVNNRARMLLECYFIIFFSITLKELKQFYRLWYVWMLFSPSFIDTFSDWKLVVICRNLINTMYTHTLFFTTIANLS